MDRGLCRRPEHLQRVDQEGDAPRVRGAGRFSSDARQRGRSPRDGRWPGARAARARRGRSFATCRSRPTDRARTSPGPLASSRVLPCPIRRSPPSPTSWWRPFAPRTPRGSCVSSRPAGMLPVERGDRIRALLAVLSDPEEEIAAQARETLEALPLDELTAFLEDSDPTEKELDVVSLYSEDPFVLERVIRHRHVSDDTLRRLAATASGAPQEALIVNQVRLLRTPDLIDGAAAEPDPDGRRAPPAQRAPRGVLRQGAAAQGAGAPDPGGGGAAAPRRGGERRSGGRRRRPPRAGRAESRSREGRKRTTAARVSARSSSGSRS